LIAEPKQEVDTPVLKNEVLPDRQKRKERRISKKMKLSPTVVFLVALFALGTGISKSSISLG
jgi:hypothetical protein